MTRGTHRWSVYLTAAAEADFQNILRWTNVQFGEAQARAYAATLSMALEALTGGPGIIGSRPRDDIIKGLFMLHVARDGRKGRHFVMFRINSNETHPVIEVLRLLHDAMDLPSHLYVANEEK